MADGGYAGRWPLRVWLILALALFAALAFAPANASAETRSLKLYFLHTGEKAIIAYKKDGKYIPSGLQKVNKFLRDWRRNEPTKMDPQLLDLVWEVYRQSGSKDYIHIVSAYRSPATNTMLRQRGRGVAKFSQHMLGKAMDFFLPDVKLAKLRELGLKAGVGGVGYYPTSGSPFVHLDTGSVRHWPRMSRTELARIFPNGKTMHVPTDGKPLPGYNTALASYNARKETGGTALASKDAKKKENVFTRLFASARQEQEEDEEANSVPGPRSVTTVATGDNPATTGIPLQVAEPLEETAEEPEPIAPVPASSPFGQDIELAFVPVPDRRPDYAPPALFAERPAEEAPATVMAALTADEIEDLRRTAIPAPRPRDRPVPPQLAFAEQTPDEEEPVDQNAARQAILDAINAPAPQMRPAPGQQPLAPMPDPSPITVASIPQVPDSRPGAAPRTLELALAATQEPENSASQAIRSLMAAGQRMRQTAGLESAGVDFGRPTGDRVTSGARPQNQIIMARADSRDTTPIDITEGIQPTDWGNITRAALTGFQSIENVNEVRAPAYGMSTLRRYPSETLSAGFVKTASIQTADGFTGSTLLVPAFTRHTN